MRDQGTQHTSLREPTCATFQVRVRNDGSG